MSAEIPRQLRVLAISGSLRAKSINTAALLALQSLTPADVEVTLYRGLAELPHFNPDFDGESVPGPVAELRRAVKSADALVICTPEYAHGLPGSLKNALDWLVSFEGLIDKRVAVINARPEATIALHALFEILAVMNTRLIDDACVTLPLKSNSLDAPALLAMPEVRAELTVALEAIVEAVRAR